MVSYPGLMWRFLGTAGLAATLSVVQASAVERVVAAGELVSVSSVASGSSIADAASAVQRKDADSAIAANASRSATITKTPAGRAMTSAQRPLPATRHRTARPIAVGHGIQGYAAHADDASDGEHQKVGRAAGFQAASKSKCKIPTSSCGLNLFRNGLHHIVDRSCARDRQLHVLDESLVVFGKSLQRCLGFHLHDLVAAGFQTAQQRWQCFCRVLLEIMHQDDALARLLELGHHGIDDLRRVLGLEIK